jgi:hypothetical protein
MYMSLSLCIEYAHKFRGQHFSVMIILSNIYLISGFAGPRYADDGSVLPHSLLGTFSEFKKIALDRGDLLVLFFFLSYKLVLYWLW